MVADSKKYCNVQEYQKSIFPVVRAFFFCIKVPVGNRHDAQPTIFLIMKTHNKVLVNIDGVTCVSGNFYFN